MTSETPDSPRRDDAPVDPVAWLDDHGDALYRYALLHSGDVNLAEDLVQETLLAALEAAHRFDHKSSERTWLIGILKHKLIDHLRRAGRRSAAGSDVLDEIIDVSFTRRGLWRDGPQRWKRDPAGAMSEREFWDVLAMCLKLLPPHAAFAFSQRTMQDSSTDEVCKALDVTPTNLWTILHRARLRLRRCLEENWFTRTS